MTLVRKTLRDARTWTVAIGVVTAFMALVDVALYPTYRDTLKDFEYPEAFKGFLGEAGSISTPEGFLATEFFSWIPLLLITVAIVGGTGTLAGEEAAGTLDLVLAQPVGRLRLVLEKAAGLVLAVSLAALASLPGFALASFFVDIELGRWRILAAVLNMLPITLLFLGASLWASTALPSRAAAAMAVTGVLVLTYFLNMLGAAVSILETPRKLSPFYWADGGHVLIHGFDWVRAGAMVAAAALFCALAVWSFDRRDIATGAREWSLRGAAGWMRRPRSLGHRSPNTRTGDDRPKYQA